MSEELSEGKTSGQEAMRKGDLNRKLDKDSYNGTRTDSSSYEDRQTVHEQLLKRRGTVKSNMARKAATVQKEAENENLRHVCTCWYRRLSFDFMATCVSVCNRPVRMRYFNEEKSPTETSK